MKKYSIRIYLNTKRGRFKKSLTINKKMYKFKGTDLIEKKLNTNKNKEGNKH